MSEPIFHDDAGRFEGDLVSKHRKEIDAIDGAFEDILVARESLLFRIEELEREKAHLETALAAANAENEQLRETLDLFRKGCKA